jgi:N-acetyl-anhydromuramyl-L-alanine amidase AmpD
MKLSQYSTAYAGKAHNGGPRQLSEITTVVIHDTEGATDEGGAITLTTRTDASSHLVLDDDSCYRLLGDGIVAWTQQWNQTALAIEQAGFASWSTATWLDHDKMLRRAAYWTAWWCLRYDLPREWLDVTDLNAGKIRGITSHNNVSLSNLSASTHTDPGPHYPYDQFMKFVRYYYWRLKRHLVPRPSVVE